MATGRPETALADTKMVEVIAVPPRTGGTAEKKRAWQGSQGLGVVQSSEGTLCFPNPSALGKVPASSSQDSERLGVTFHSILWIVKGGLWAGLSRTEDMRQRWR